LFFSEKARTRLIIQEDIFIIVKVGGAKCKFTLLAKIFLSQFIVIISLFYT